jgi:uncharacterized protein (TIGR00375 family)
MKFIADFHIHSKYSRATSPEMNVETLSRWAQIKGINLLGTGDFTHPNYFAELRLRLEDAGNGFFTLKKGEKATHFILTAEISNIFTHNGRGRRIHTLILAPSFDVVSKINTRLKKMGNITSDGRPIFGQPVRDMVKMILDISPECFIVPAHAWTPWFSLYGANSGFDSIEECFGDEAKNIHCIETGLSSDPAMNWRLSKLDKISLISNSDAHSPRKIGREANVFDAEFSYKSIIDILKNKDPKRFLYTIEFFPEEGKYHFDGHRSCNVVQSPEESKKTNNLCPACKKPLTIGVMHRIEALADRANGFVPPNSIPYKNLVPLEEIIADALDVSTGTAAVEREYEKMIEKCGSEFNILLNMSLDEITRFTQEKIARGIKLVREGKLHIAPGHDGVYGKIKIFNTTPEKTTANKNQLSAFKLDRPNQMNLF